MARDPKDRPEVAALIRSIEESRNGLGEQVAQLKRTLDVPSRVRHSVAARPIAWFGGSLGAGLIASRLLRRKPKKAPKKKMTGFLFNTILTLLKPALKGLIIGEIQRRLKVHTTSKNPAVETHLPLSKT